MKVKVFENKRPVTESRSFTFYEDPPGEEGKFHGTPYEFELIALDPFEDAQAGGFAAEIVARYVTGGWVDEVGDQRKAHETILVDGRRITPDADAFWFLAIIERMQGIRREYNDDRPQDKYTVPELAAIVVTVPNVWAQLKAEVNRLRNGGPGVWTKKDSAAATET